jgi:hypothetical protein
VLPAWYEVARYLEVDGDGARVRDVR